jgi:hypothetical protein
VGEAFVTRQLMRQYCGDDDDDAGTVHDAALWLMAI